MSSLPDLTEAEIEQQAKDQENWLKAHTIDSKSGRLGDQK
jgi:hypothetical protein